MAFRAQSSMNDNITIVRRKNGKDLDKRNRLEMEINTKKSKVMIINDEENQNQLPIIWG